jgi:hypothetical protein
MLTNLTIESLLLKIKLGEGIQTEFKSELPINPKIAKEMAALANSYGGYILVGVADDGEIIGINPEEDMDELKCKIVNIASSACHPNIQPKLTTVNVDDKIVLVIGIEQGTIPLVSTRDKIYIRVDSVSREADNFEIQERLIEREAAIRNKQWQRGVAPAGVRLVSFAYAYSQPPIVNVTVNSAEPRLAQVVNVNNTGFIVLIYDLGGKVKNDVSFMWVAMSSSAVDEF